MKTILLSLILSLTFSIRLQNRDFHVSSMQPVIIINVQLDQAHIVNNVKQAKKENENQKITVQAAEENKEEKKIEKVKIKKEEVKVKKTEINSSTELFQSTNSTQQVKEEKKIEQAEIKQEKQENAPVQLIKPAEKISAETEPVSQENSVSSQQLSKQVKQIKIQLLDSSSEEWVKVSNFDSTEQKFAKPKTPAAPVFSCASSCSPDASSGIQGQYFAGCKAAKKKGDFPANDCSTECLYFRTPDPVGNTMELCFPTFVNNKEFCSQQCAVYKTTKIGKDKNKTQTDTFLCKYVDRRAKQVNFKNQYCSQTCVEKETPQGPNVNQKYECIPK